MKTLKNGDQEAFPRAGQWDREAWGHEGDGIVMLPAKGLTKREYLAAMALQAAYGFFHEGYCGPVRDCDHNTNVVARVAVQLADALLAELEHAPVAGQQQETGA